MAEVKVEFRAHGARYERPYVALVNGKPLLDGRGAMRRFKTVVAALDAGNREADREIAKPGTVSLATWRTRDAEKIMDEASGGVRACRYTNEPGGACWRQGKAVELCTCHSMTDKDFAESVKRHAECRTPNTPGVNPYDGGQSNG